MMKPDWMPKSVLKYFSSNPMDPLSEISYVHSNTEHFLNEDLVLAFNDMPSAIWKLAFDDENFRGLYCRGDMNKIEYFAKEWMMLREIRNSANQLRMSGLLNREPYNHPALSDVAVTDDGLVSISNFEICSTALIRNGFAFTLALTKTGHNSSSWLTQSIVSSEHRDSILVRLDPLIYGDATDFMPIEHRMLWWGEALTWNEIIEIRKEKFGRWAPNNSLGSGVYTDYSWAPKNNEHQLLLEEIPDDRGFEYAGSRYFHCIFSNTRNSVLHMDGAIRYFNREQLVNREKKHVRNAGKAGKRVKIFRLDGEIEAEVVADIASNFYVWNYDVADFFGMNIPSGLLS